MNIKDFILDRLQGAKPERLKEEFFVWVDECCAEMCGILF
jgi:hypothetical protein